MATPGTGSSRLQPTLQSAVQSVQWTYSLFWQFCPQQGILVWSDGYYNGAIKTRKTVQPMEVTAEEASLQRSQQLRELYDSLSAGETNQPARRPCAALSPEDLTESEWFYLMCVSFSFPTGTGLPGKAYAKRQYVWLTGANEVDSKVFSRAILAKSARVQTVVCIPLLDGVVELGTTERVQEDPSMVQHVITFFADHQHHPPPKPALSGHSTSNPATATSSSNQPSRFNSPPLPTASAAAAAAGTATTMYVAAEPTPGTATNNPAGNQDVDEDEEEEEDLTNAESDSEAVTGRNSQLLLPAAVVGGEANLQHHHHHHQSVLQIVGSEGGAGVQGEPSELMQLEMSEDIRLGSPDDASNNLDSSSDFPPHHHHHHHRRVASAINSATAAAAAAAATLTTTTGMLSHHHHQRRGGDNSTLKSPTTTTTDSGRRWPSAALMQQQQQQQLHQPQYDPTATGQQQQLAAAAAAPPAQHLHPSDIALGELSQEDTHYSQTVSVILQYQSNRWPEPSTTPGNNGLLSFSPNSAFSKWTTRSDLHLHLPTEGTSQWFLKYILFTVPFLHSKHKSDVDNNNNIAPASPKSSRELNDPTSRLRNSSNNNNNGSKGGGGTPQDELSANHVLAERRRREKLNERFIILRSLVPFVTKMDKASILGDTIEYVKQLRRKIQDLETHTRQMETERVHLVEAAKSAEIQRSLSNNKGSMDQTTQWPSSGVTRVAGPSSSAGSHDKRKIRVVEGSGGIKAAKAVVEPQPQQQQQLGDMLQVSIIESDALIELQCPYKEGLLLDVMLVLREMRVEVTGVQSSLQNGSFTAELRAKVKENVNGKKASIVEVKRAINQIIPQTDS